MPFHQPKEPPPNLPPQGRQPNLQEEDQSKGELSPKAQLLLSRGSPNPTPNSFDLALSVEMWEEGLEVCYLGLLKEEHPTLYNKLNRQDPEQTEQTQNPQNRTRKQHANQNKSNLGIQTKTGQQSENKQRNILKQEATKPKQKQEPETEMRNKD